MKAYYETPQGSIDLTQQENGGGDISRMRVFTPQKRSRTTTRRIDFRVQEDYFEKIVQIGRELLIEKRPINEIAQKHGISRKTVWRYKTRFLAQAQKSAGRTPLGEGDV